MRGIETKKDEAEELASMSVLGHLEELRSRLLRCLAGIAVAVVLSFTFTDALWEFVKQPAKAALIAAGQPPLLMQTQSMEVVTVIWFKLPLVCAVFLASPWVLYQLWAFISPGLYLHERRWAAPFIVGSAGLFIAGGVFGYFMVFRYGLTFLLSVGRGRDVTPGITVTDYFDKFVNVILGVGVSFELPVLDPAAGNVGDCDAWISAAPQQVCHSCHRDRCGSNYSHHGPVQPDASGGAVVRTLLRGHRCGISGDAAARRTRGFEEGTDRNRRWVSCGCGVLVVRAVWPAIDLALAFPGPRKPVASSQAVRIGPCAFAPGQLARASGIISTDDFPGYAAWSL